MTGAGRPVIRVGTRGSRLAMAQTRVVIERLGRAHGGVRFEPVEIRSEADDRPDAMIGAPAWPAGGFVGALERALLRGEVDLVVHSYKDLGVEPAPGLVIASVPERGPHRDVLVTRAGGRDPSTPGFRIGTGSPRRTAQIGRALPGAEVVPIRGNVPTRVCRVAEDDLDGVVVAEAGLVRLGMMPAAGGGGPALIEGPGPDRLATPLDPRRHVPAGCQGAVAVQARSGDAAARLGEPIDDPDARAATDAERRFLRGVGATCHTPVGVLAHDGEITAQVFSADGSCREGRAAMVEADALAARLRAGT